MTATTAARRRVALASAALAAVALVAGMASTAATATEDAQGTTMAAKSRDAKARSARAVRTVTAPQAPAAVVAASPTDFTSIFAGQLPAYTNSGWSACPAPITWNVDNTGLDEAQTAQQMANLEYAFAQWTAASGLTFQFLGGTDLVVDETYFSLKAADGSPTPSRHINLAFLDDASSALLGGTTVGMAGPTAVWAGSQEVDSGAGIFLLEAVEKMSDTQARALYTHELGHVLGLGHANDAGNIMSPVVGERSDLGAGDIAGVRTMTKPCAAPANPETL